MARAFLRRARIRHLASPQRKQELICPLLALRAEEFPQISTDPCILPRLSLQWRETSVFRSEVLSRADPAGH